MYVKDTLTLFCTGKLIPGGGGGVGGGEGIFFFFFFFFFFLSRSQTTNGTY